VAGTANFLEIKNAQKWLTKYVSHFCAQENPNRMPYLSFNDAEHYYEVEGQGTPLVFIHAGIANREMWDPQVEHFARNYRVILFDQRGVGKTTTITKKFNRRADLLALLDHLNAQKAILVGCSMGGSLALDFTLEHPERVERLVLIAASPSGMERDPELVKGWAEQDAAFEAGDYEKVIELECQMWVDGPNRKRDEVSPAVREKVAAMERENLKIDTDGYDSVPLEPPAAGRLSEVRVPTLVIVGTGDQPSVVTAANMMAREIPHAELVMYEGVGHVPNMEKPEEVNRAIEKFLTKS
jgi:pimeloyl-ACP methyl ester carboxylesterase